MMRPVLAVLFLTAVSAEPLPLRRRDAAGFARGLRAPHRAGAAQPPALDIRAEQGRRPPHTSRGSATCSRPTPRPAPAPRRRGGRERARVIGEAAATREPGEDGHRGRGGDGGLRVIDDAIVDNYGRVYQPPSARGRDDAQQRLGRPLVYEGYGCAMLGRMARIRGRTAVATWLPARDRPPSSVAALRRRALPLRRRDAPAARRRARARAVDAAPPAPAARPRTRRPRRRATGACTCSRTSARVGAAPPSPSEFRARFPFHVA